MKNLRLFWMPLLLLLGVGLGGAALANAASTDLVYRPDTFGLDWTAIKLFALGAALLFAEFFIPGFGICGISGICCILASFYFALGGSRDTLPVLAGGLVVVLVVGALLMKFLPENPVWKLFALPQSPKDKVEEVSSTTYLGKTGTALTLLRPSGVVLIDGKRVDALTEGEFIAEGTSIKVVKEEGRKIFVEKEN